MPRGKRRGRSDRNRNEGSLNSSEDESLENASVQSNMSEQTEDCEETENLAQEQLEEKLCELIDSLTQKSSQGRINCFQSLTKAFVKKYMPSFLRDRCLTICDSIERSLKKGGVAERVAAAELATIVCVQLGAEERNTLVLDILKPTLINIICDNTASATLRAKCCTALGNILYLSGGDIAAVVTFMQQLQDIFSGSFLKGDGNIPNVSPEMATLHAAAINTWSLLFTLVTPGNMAAVVDNSKTLFLEKFSELLESPHLEVRMAAGEAIALIYESGRELSDDYEEDFASDLAESLKQLATDSHKYRAKKDRKQQRATFRDILQFVQNNTVPEVQVKFNKEVLILDSWSRRKQYDCLCNILGPSINVHLTDNDLLRDIFEIEAAAPSDIAGYAQHQMERYRKRLLNAANFKARTISRAKNRDKRSDF